MDLYYVVEIKNGRNKIYIIWYSNDLDCVLTECNNVLVFKSITDLSSYCSKNDFYTNKTPVVYDFGLFKEQSNGSFENLDYDVILDFWNLSSDIARSIKYDFVGDQESPIVSSIYDKVFHGNNLPTINSSGTIYLPKLTDDEKLCFSNIMADIELLINSKIIN